MLKGIMAWILAQDVVPGPAHAQPHKVKLPQIVTPLGHISHEVVSPTGVLPRDVILTTAIANPAQDPMSAKGPTSAPPAALQIFGGAPETMSNNSPGGLG